MTKPSVYVENQQARRRAAQERLSRTEEKQMWDETWNRARLGTVRPDGLITCSRRRRSGDEPRRCRRRASVPRATPRARGRTFMDPLGLALDNGHPARAGTNPCARNFRLSRNQCQEIAQALGKPDRWASASRPFALSSASPARRSALKRDPCAKGELVFGGLPHGLWVYPDVPHGLGGLTQTAPTTGHRLAAPGRARAHDRRQGLP